MKKLYRLAVTTVTMLLFASCETTSPYDDSEILNKFNNLSSRVTALESQVAAINGNITALQTIVSASQTGISISAVTQLENGYIIIFSNGNVITITNGKNGVDGKDGANGKDGQDGKNGTDGKDGAAAPVLGVSILDGVYYWTITINGQTSWLTDTLGNKLRVTGENGKDGTNGKDGADGKDGQDGKDGKDGTDGQNGVTPIVNINADGYWCISYDGGQTFNLILDADGNPISALGKDGADGQDGEDGKDGADGQDGKDGEDGKDGADGQDGKDGEDGKDGSSGGASITIVQDDENVHFTLPDGSVITIPIKKYTLITIEVDGLQTFSFNETKAFTVTLADDIETMIVKPDGWRVALGETLAITAPALNNQNAELAGYIAISATDINGYNEIFKIQVETISQYLDIPDAVFKEYLTTQRNIVCEFGDYLDYTLTYGEVIDADGDGEISFNEAANITGIQYNNALMESLQCIEQMPNLQFLSVNGNNLTSLDLSGNPHLKYLSCNNNKLKTLDLTANTELEYLLASKQYAPVTESSAPQTFTALVLFNDTTAALDNEDANKENDKQFGGKVGFGQFSEPRYAETDNGLETLTLGNHPKLYYINCQENRLNSINVGKYPELRQLRVNSNDLTEIDVSRNPKLEALYFESNDIATFDISNNPLLEGFGCGYNPLTSFAIPSNISLLYLYFAGIGLSSLDTIASQTELLTLDFSSTLVTSANLSIFPNLTTLSCSSSKLATLDVSGCPNLQSISCYYSTKLTEINVANNTKLQSLDCDSCPLTSLDVSNCPELNYLWTCNNTIGSLDLSNNPLLQTLICYNCGLTELDLTNNINVTLLRCYGNALTTLDISDTAIKANLDCNPMNDADGNNLLATLYATTTQIGYKSSWDIPATTTVVEKNIYESSDYSADGTILTLQSATVGNGINLIIMGDGFVDTAMSAGGAYETWMTNAMNNFFSEEPYTSLRNRFNVYTVKAVSRHGIYSPSTETVFGCQFGDGTYISGDDSKVFSYATKITEQNINAIDLDKSLVLVVLNSPRYAGTCWMYYSGAAIAYQPITNYDNDQFAQVVCHEAGGHGFSKLLDEYQYSGTIPSSEIDAFITQRDDYGWGFNVDITNDPSTIQWARYLSDERYSSSVGIYEGAMTYEFGAWRPTDNSIMRHNTGGYNAPSRESIYRRAMSISEDNWTFDFETFAAFDAPSRSTAAMAKRRAQSAKVDVKKFVPLTPPVVVKGSWRDAK